MVEENRNGHSIKNLQTFVETGGGKPRALLPFKPKAYAKKEHIIRKLY